MIDIITDHIVTLSQLAKRLPVRRRQRPVHPSTAHRWRSPGIRGIRLECIKIGGIWYTSLEAFQRFCERLSQAATLTEPPNPSPPLSDKDAFFDQLQQQFEAALDSLGA